MTHTVNLGTPPRLPFDNVEVVKHVGEGVVEIELRSDDNLYIDGKRVVLHVSKRQMRGGLVTGYEVREELEGNTLILLNSNVLDYLYDHPELFPEHWKKNKQHEAQGIYFWGSIFRDLSDGILFVCCLYYFGNEMRRLNDWLGEDWPRLNLSASLAG